MLWLELIGLLILSRAEVTAWALARERPYYRPIALLLGADLCSILAALALRHASLSTQRRPYTGLARLAFHVEQLAGLVWPVGVAAVALVVLARRPAWPAFAVGAAVLLARITLYPWLRGDRLAWFLLGEQVALVALCGWACWRVTTHTRTVERSPAPLLLEHHRAALWIVATEAAMLAGPHLLFRGTPFDRWWIAQIGYSALFLWLTILHWRWACRARRLIS